MQLSARVVEGRCKRPVAADAHSLVQLRLGKVSHATKAATTDHPEWNETFTFSTKKKEQELEVLWYEKRFMGKALVGRTAVVLRQLPRDAPEDAWLPLTAERDVEVRLVLHASGFGAASIPDGPSLGVSPSGSVSSFASPDLSTLAPGDGPSQLSEDEVSALQEQFSHLNAERRRSTQRHAKEVAELRAKHFADLEALTAQLREANERVAVAEARSPAINTGAAEEAAAEVERLQAALAEATDRAEAASAELESHRATLASDRSAGEEAEDPQQLSELRAKYFAELAALKIQLRDANTRATLAEARPPLASPTQLADAAAVAEVERLRAALAAAMGRAEVAEAALETHRAQSHRSDSHELAELRAALAVATQRADRAEAQLKESVASPPSHPKRRASHRRVRDTDSSADDSTTSSGSSEAGPTAQPVDVAAMAEVERLQAALEAATGRAQAAEAALETHRAQSRRSDSHELAQLRAALAVATQRADRAEAQLPKSIASPSSQPKRRASHRRVPDTDSSADSITTTTSSTSSEAGGPRGRRQPPKPLPRITVEPPSGTSEVPFSPLSSVVGESLSLAEAAELRAELLRLQAANAVLQAQQQPQPPQQQLATSRDEALPSRNGLAGPAEQPCPACTAAAEQIAALDREAQRLRAERAALAERVVASEAEGAHLQQQAEGLQALLEALQAERRMLRMAAGLPADGSMQHAACSPMPRSLGSPAPPGLLFPDHHGSPPGHRRHSQPTSPPAVQSPMAAMAGGAVGVQALSTEVQELLEEWQRWRDAWRYDAQQWAQSVGSQALPGRRADLLLKWACDQEAFGRIAIELRQRLERVALPLPTSALLPGALLLTSDAGSEAAASSQESSDNEPGFISAASSWRQQSGAVPAPLEPALTVPAPPGRPAVGSPGGDATLPQLRAFCVALEQARRQEIEAQEDSDRQLREAEAALQTLYAPLAQFGLLLGPSSGLAAETVPLARPAAATPTLCTALATAQTLQWHLQHQDARLRSAEEALLLVDRLQRLTEQTARLEDERRGVAAAAAAAVRHAIDASVPAPSPPRALLPPPARTETTPSPADAWLAEDLAYSTATPAADSPVQRTLVRLPSSPDRAVWPTAPYAEADEEQAADYAALHAALEALQRLLRRRAARSPAGAAAPPARTSRPSAPAPSPRRTAREWRGAGWDDPTLDEPQEEVDPRHRPPPVGHPPPPREGKPGPSRSRRLPDAPPHTLAGSTPPSSATSPRASQPQPYPAAARAMASSQAPPGPPIPTASQSQSLQSLPSVSEQPQSQHTPRAAPTPPDVSSIAPISPPRQSRRMSATAPRYPPATTSVMTATAFPTSFHSPYRGFRDAPRAARPSFVVCRPDSHNRKDSPAKEVAAARRKRPLAFT